MAISINIGGNKSDTLKGYIIYRRKDNQTPCDFAVSYLMKLEDLQKFYKEFQLNSYSDFYNFETFRIPLYRNIMRVNEFESETKPDVYYSQYTFEYNTDFSTDFNS